MKRALFVIFAAFWLTFWVSGCSPSYEASLPNSLGLGSPRGLRMARVITHYHSPYSYDACDTTGIAGLTTSCLTDLRTALCRNHVDFIFMSDHPSNAADYDVSTLLLLKDGDTTISSGGLPVANQMADCGDSFRPLLMAGFESRLMALGMTQHLSADPATRKSLYETESAAVAGQLVATSDAIVAIPHTESRSVALIQSLSPHAIEIYNIHANIDPKIRKTDMGLPPFELMPGILTYLADPWGTLNADYMFMNFFGVHSTYSQKWNAVIASGLKVAGIGATDSHENVFAQSASDGERLDSHRRMTRFMSNHYTVSSVDVASIKDAVKSGKGWLVFEGLGSPVGMDLYATGVATAGPGDTTALLGGHATITVRIPSLHADSPQGGEAPVVRIALKRVNVDGTDTTVATATGSDLTYDATAAGAYRAELFITPKHLKPFLGPFSDNASTEYPWIITNHVYLN